MSAALLLERVSYRYPDAASPSLRDIDLHIAPGEFVVLAGGSGSGKSTLLRAASGLVPHFHGGEFTGRLESGGLDTRTHEPAQIAAVAGTLFQDPETQVVMGTVGAELAFPLENRGLAPAAVARGVEEAALALGIAQLLERSTHALSGGELQRVALGAALAGRPRVALLDEPTSQLDPVAGDELLGVLRRLNEEWGTAVLLAEHRLERCLSAADRVVALRDGAVVCDADPRGFLDWAAQHAPELQTPGSRLFSLAGRRPLPVSVKDARRTLAADGAGLYAAGRLPAATAPTFDGWRSDVDMQAEGARGGAQDRPAGDGGRFDGDMRGEGARGGARDRPAGDGGRFDGDMRGEGARGAAPAEGGRRRRRPRGRSRRHAVRAERALTLSSVWVEHRGGAAVLRGVDLAIAAGERVALMGRNGAGKSTLLRVAAGLTAPTRGSVRRGGRVALLMQNPGDYTLRDRVGDELPADVLAAAGLGGLVDRHPRDISGGERQRLALALVLHGDRPAVLCLDEPTRGMDRGHKDALATLLRALAADGTAVIVATHDAEFAASFAARTVLLGDGRPVADAPTAEVLAGGWYFATQTARILGGAALLPEDGAALLRRDAVVA